MNAGFLIVIGLGNIGSHLVSALASLPFLRRVLLVDFDHYQRSNLGSQACVESDEGRLKTAVQAGRLSALNPHLKVEIMATRLEKLPLGIFHQADWVVSGLDSRLARIRLNERIFKVAKTAWIDAGVDGESGLARASVFPVGTGKTPPQACFECSLSDGDYRMIESAHLCSPESHLPTNASAELGKFAAALVIEQLEALHARTETEGPYEIHACLGHSGAAMKSKLSPNPACRFQHVRLSRDLLHRVDLPVTTLGDLFDFTLLSPSVPCLGPWLTEIACLSCGARRPVLFPLHRMDEELRCGNCRGEMRALGTGMTETIPANYQPSTINYQPSLAECGLQIGDWLTFFPEATSAKPTSLTMELI